MNTTFLRNMLCVLLLIMAGHVSAQTPETTYNSTTYVQSFTEPRSIELPFNNFIEDGPIEIYTEDVNKDGKKDLFYVGSSYAFLLKQLNGTFQGESFPFPERQQEYYNKILLENEVTFFDYNRDNVRDLYVSNNGVNDALLLSTPDGSYKQSSLQLVSRQFNRSFNYFNNTFEANNEAYATSFSNQFYSESYYNPASGYVYNEDSRNFSASLFKVSNNDTITSPIQVITISLAPPGYVYGLLQFFSLDRAQAVDENYSPELIAIRSVGESEYNSLFTRYVFTSNNLFEADVIDKPVNLYIPTSYSGDEGFGGSMKYFFKTDLNQDNKNVYFFGLDGISLSLDLDQPGIPQAETIYTPFALPGIGGFKDYDEDGLVDYILAYGEPDTDTTGVQLIEYNPQTKSFEEQAYARRASGFPLPSPENGVTDYVVKDGVVYYINDHRDLFTYLLRFPIPFTNQFQDEMRANAYSKGYSVRSLKLSSNGLNPISKFFVNQLYNQPSRSRPSNNVFPVEPRYPGFQDNLGVYINPIRDLEAQRILIDDLNGDGLDDLILAIGGSDVRYFAPSERTPENAGDKAVDVIYPLQLDIYFGGEYAANGVWSFE